MNDFFGDLIREKRLEKALTYKELAEKCDCSFTYLSDIEKHRQYPVEQIFEKLIDTLDLTHKKEYLFLLMLREKMSSDYRHIVDNLIDNYEEAEDG